MTTTIAPESYTFGEIGAEKASNHSAVRNLFAREPGGLPVGKPGSKRPPIGYRRTFMHESCSDYQARLTPRRQ
jgi:hypothetical protein